MGILGIATTAGLRAFSILPEVKDMDEAPLQGYIDRAEWALSRKYDYDTTNPSYAGMMKIAVFLLTENMVLKGLPSYRRSMLVDIVSERIGTYSYTRGTPGQGTVKMYADGMDDEIYAIARALATKGDVETSYTHVFVRQTFIVDKSGVRWYLPEDEDLKTKTQIQDPPLPFP